MQHTISWRRCFSPLFGNQLIKPCQCMSKYIYIRCTMHMIPHYYKLSWTDRPWWISKINQIELTIYLAIWAIRIFIYKFHGSIRSPIHVRKFHVHGEIKEAQLLSGSRAMKQLCSPRVGTYDGIYTHVCKKFILRWSRIRNCWIQIIAIADIHWYYVPVPTPDLWHQLMGCLPSMPGVPSWLSSAPGAVSHSPGWWATACP